MERKFWALRVAVCLSASGFLPTPSSACFSCSVFIEWVGHSHMTKNRRKTKKKKLGEFKEAKDPLRPTKTSHPFA